jgi:hypothetical protein
MAMASTGISKAIISRRGENSSKLAKESVGIERRKIGGGVA